MTTVDGVALRLRHTTPEAQLSGLLQLHQVLLRVADSIGPSLELQPVLHAVLDALRSIMSFRGGSIGLVEHGDVVLAAMDPPVSAEVRASRIPVGSGLVGRVVASGRPIYCPDLDEDPRVDKRLRSPLGGARFTITLPALRPG